MKKISVKHSIALVAVCCSAALHVDAQVGHRLLDSDLERQNKVTTFSGMETVVDVTPIIAEYKGDMTIADKVVAKDTKIALRKSTDGKVNLHLEKLSLEGLSAGEVDINNIPVTLSGKTYQFESEYVAVTFAFVIKSDVKAVGSVVGDAVTINIKAYVGGDKSKDKSESEPTAIVVFKGTNVNSGVFETMVDNVLLYVVDKTVYAKGYSGLLQVFDTKGGMVFEQEVEGKTSFSLEDGIYIVRMGDKTSKILVE